MAAIASAVIGVAAAGAGLYMNQKGSKEANRANQQITEASMRAEALRAQQMRLDTFRRQRELIRQSLIARSTAIAGATAQGSQNSSGLLGGLAQVAGMAGMGVQAQGENQQIGEGLFSANRDRMQAELALGNARTTQATGNGLFSLGSSMVNNAKTFGNVYESVVKGVNS